MNDFIKNDLNKIVCAVAAELEGSLDSLSGVLERLDLDPGLENNQIFCDTLDTKVFCCAICGWWFDVSETGNDVNGQWACIECGGE